MESLFFGGNVSTAIPVAQARGVALLAVVQQDMLFAEYIPSEVKLAATGYEAAKKAQVGEMVCRLLHLAAIPQPDAAADAAAIATCHAHTFRLEHQQSGNERGQRTTLRWALASAFLKQKNTS